MILISLFLLPSVCIWETQWTPLMSWEQTPVKRGQPNFPTVPKVTAKFSPYNNLLFFVSTLFFCFLEQPPPRPPQPAILLKSKFISIKCYILDWHFQLRLFCLEPFYDSVIDDYDDEDDTSTSSGLKKLGMSLGLKLRPWEASGVRSAKSEVSLIDFTDDSFSSTTPSPLTEPNQRDDDTLKV